MKLSLCVVAFSFAFVAGTYGPALEGHNALHADVLAPDPTTQNTSTADGARMVDASWIRDAVTKHERIQLRHVVIRGRLELQDLTIEDQFDLGDCVIKDYADFSHTTFKRDAFFSDATFLGGLSFQDAVFEHKATFQRTRFVGDPIIFEEAHFLDLFSAAEAQFGSKGGGTAIFTHARFDGTADFSMSIFNGGVHFIRTQFSSQGHFPGVRFLGNADFGRAHFFDWTTFGAGESPNFNSTFSGKAIFIEAQFDSITWFNGVDFKDDAEFLGARFGNEAYFLGVTFGGVASFDRAQILGSALFSPQEGALTSNFAKPAHFQRAARFPGARLSSEVRFVGVGFDGKADFSGAHFEGDVHFEDSVFHGPVSFRSTAFSAVYFSRTAREQPPQFAKDVDLIGCTYDRIQVDWQSFLRYPNGQSRVEPFDHQPYIYLAEVLRRAGSEKDADAVYEERLRVQSTKLSGWRKFKDNVYWLFANYGIDLWHESVAALLVLLLGALIFSRPAAVLSGEDSKTEVKISWRNAFFLAVHQFLPLSLPVKPEWSPSRRVLLKWRQYPLLTAATYANFLQIIGWIIIPLTVAALSGVLRRAAQ
ncbi:MAG TPA: pentapeptide repeat-containing protein [Candidatus Eremiobacteraceae bacterium]|nr:pentapeptide repeat-containing protein [Candidatus Eremiobacteraceae bacterium]